jgi:GxxExxY protein
VVLADGSSLDFVKIVCENIGRLIWQHHLTDMTENEISHDIVDCAFKVHNTLGPGLLETVYRAALAHELKKRGFNAVEERGIPAAYDDVYLELGFRADIIVNNKVIVEIKSIDALAPIHGKILLTYLRLTDLRLGLLINFNVELIKDGIRRVVNKL